MRDQVVSGGVLLAVCEQFASMMQAVYYRDRQGHEPVKANIDALPPAVQDELDWHIDLLTALTDWSSGEVGIRRKKAMLTQ